MRSWYALLLSMGVVLGLASGCSDSDPPPSVDETPPQVAVLFPPERIDRPWEVSDTTQVYVAATDPVGVATVSVWYQRPTDVQQRLVDTTTEPISFDQVPDSIQSEFSVPDGWDLYTVIWGTQNIASGTRPQLFATAVDRSDNEGIASATTVLILNTRDLGTPTADFDIRPPTGDLRVVFTFDPSLTDDPIEDLENIDVRWDFDGDGVWDIDWDAGAKADELQTWQFVEAKTYRPKMEARNTYFEEIGQSPPDRSVVVNPIGGCPNPPETMRPIEENFSDVPARTYVRGAANREDASINEFPVHNVRLTASYKILNREVTNEEYLNYLRDAIETTRVDFRQNQVWATDSTGFRYMDLSNSRIFFNIDLDDFEVEPGYQTHPVTGVTWYGANDFAFRYGLRLPTEAEWEIAARGDSTMWRYPYGREITEGDPTGRRRVNYVDSGDPFDGAGGTTPVRYFNGQPNGEGFETVDTPSYFGLYDLSGNAAEWVSDWFGPYPEQVTVTNPQGPVEGVFKVVRGGSYQRSPASVRVSYRDGERTPVESFPSIGFRVAYFPIDCEEP